MKPLLSQLEYQQIELIIPEPQRRLKARIVRGFQAVGRSLSQLSQPLFKQPDVQVWCRRDESGNVWWSAYDPASQRSVDHISQEQMLVWIEQRYYIFK